MPTFIKQIERAFKEYPEGKLDHQLDDLWIMRHEDARVRGHRREWGPQ